MQIRQHEGLLTYCSNIHPGESWTQTLDNLKTYTTHIKEKLGAERFGIGLRISGQASKDLLEGDQLQQFKEWLHSANLYVFTVNGFPYGSFHNQRVKDEVHTPDWLSDERLAYTKRLFFILSELLPDGLDGGVSTSPVSYRHWFKNEDELETARRKGAQQMIEIAFFLHEINKSTGKLLHLDVEPEPDGILETGEEYIDFYTNYLIPAAKSSLAKKLEIAESEAVKILKDHIQLCFDVCHFAVGYEDISGVLTKLQEEGLKIGRIQISAALGTGLLTSGSNYSEIRKQLEAFDEQVYLHQAVARDGHGNLKRYRDLRPALDEFEITQPRELRTHFHVPIFLENYGKLVSTQSAIKETLKAWKQSNFTNHLEVETYTWDVLPEDLRTDIVNSVARELNWVIDTLDADE